MPPARRERPGSVARLGRRAAAGFGVAVMLVTMASSAGAATPISVTTTSLPSTEVSAPYGAHLASTGGTGVDHWSVVGVLPAGLVLSSSGVLSGRTTTAGMTEVTVMVTDSASDSAQATLGLLVAPAPVIATSALPSGQVGDDYSVVLSASGGTAPYVWSIPTGPIPGGLLLQSGGTLSGIPGTAGTTSLTLQVADALGATATHTYLVTVRPVPLVPETLNLVTTSGVLLTLTSPPSTDVAGLVSERLGGGLAKALVAVPGATGEWEVLASGRVRGVGAASLGEVVRAHAHIVGAGAADEGYWLVSATGSVFALGHAPHLGSLHRARVRIVALVPAKGGKGFWLVSATGAVYAFGTAHKARGASRGAHIVAATAAPGGKGIWALGASGRVYGLAGATALGSLPRAHRGTPVAIAPTTNGTGYWIVTRVGGVFAFGTARALPLVPPGYRVVAAAS